MRESTDTYKILENRLTYLAKTDLTKHLILATHIPIGSYVYYASMPNRILVVDRGTRDARSFEDWSKVGRKVNEGAKLIYIMAGQGGHVGVKALYRLEDTVPVIEKYLTEELKINYANNHLTDEISRKVASSLLGKYEVTTIQVDTFKELCARLNQIGKNLDSAFGIDRTWKR